MTVNTNKPTTADELHTAICQAVVLMNRTPSTEPVFHQAHTILRMALASYNATQPDQPDAAQGVTHLELLAALRVVNEIHNLGDAINNVRESVDWGAEPFDGSTWDHPRVLRYSDAVAVLKRALKEQNS